MKSVKKGSAYNYYTTSQRYAETNKYDAVAQELYKTLLEPLENERASSGGAAGARLFANLKSQEFLQKKIDLKRFACRHTYPACTSCSDLTANVPMSSAESRETVVLDMGTLFPKQPLDGERDWDNTGEPLDVTSMYVVYFAKSGCNN